MILYKLNRHFSLEGSLYNIIERARYKKFASLMSPTTSSVAQNLFYAQNQFIDITYIQKLSTFLRYYNILKRKKVPHINETLINYLVINFNSTGI